MFIVPLTELQPLASTLESIGAAEKKEEKSESFGDILKAKIQNVKDLESASLQSAYAIATGESSAIERAMMDATKASTAIEMTTQLPTRAVNAYKEILSMQI